MTIFEMEILEWNKRQFVANEGKFYWYIKFSELYRFIDVKIIMQKIIS